MPTVQAQNWTTVWDSQSPTDDRSNMLTGAVNGYLSDPANGSPFYQRPAIVPLNASAAVGTSVAQCVYEHEALSGTRYIFLFCDGKVYRANSAAMAAFTDVTPANVIIATTGKIACTSLNDFLIVSDGVNKPWKGSSLSSTPIVAATLEYDGPTPSQITGSAGIP